jgi:hypothetical protein
LPTIGDRSDRKPKNLHRMTKSVERGVSSLITKFPVLLIVKFTQ